MEDFVELFKYILDELVEQGITYINNGECVEIDLLGLYKTCPMIVRNWLNTTGIRYIEQKGDTGVFQVTRIDTKEELDERMTYILKKLPAEQEDKDVLWNCILEDLYQPTKTHLKYLENIEKLPELKLSIEDMETVNKIVKKSKPYKANKGQKF